MLNITPPKRQPDAYGQGHFGASRGSRTHKGIDFACVAGSKILSTVEGEVTKLGYPYGDDLSFRYVQVTCHKTGKLHRFFYVEPSVEKGDLVVIGEELGSSQTLLNKYTKGMTDHIHYEIMSIENNQKVYEDPGFFLG